MSTLTSTERGARRASRSRMKMCAAVGGAAAILALGACGSSSSKASSTGTAAGSSNSGSSSSGSPITVAEVVPLSGNVADYGLQADRAWQLAFKTYGSTVNGHSIKIQKYDEKCTPSAAVVAVNQALGSGAVALDGPTCSGDVTATMHLAETQHVPMLTSAYLPSITEQGDAFIWRNQASDAVLNGNLAKFIKSKGFSRVAILHGSSGFSAGEGQTMADGLKAVGLSPVADLTYTDGATDFTGQIQSIKAAHPDAVYLGGYDPDLGRIAGQMRQLGLNVQIFAGEEISYSDSIAAGGSAVNGAYAYSEFIPSAPQFQAFTSAWQSMFNTMPNSESFSYYNAAVAIIEGLKNAGANPTPQSLNAALGKLDVKTQPQLDTVAYTSTGNQRCPTVLVGQVVKGNFTMVQNASTSCS